MRALPLGLLLASLALPTDLLAQDNAKIPPPLTEYKGRTIAQFMSYQGAPWLLRATREKEESCEELLKALKIKEGDVICDMGCGNGFYSLKMAKRTGPKGKVYGVDIQTEMLTLLRERAKAARIKNVVPVHGTVIDPHLPEGEVDLVLLVDVYHEFSHPEQMLQAIRKSLKPTGRVALAEYRAEDQSVPIKPLHKMTKKQIMKEYPPNGFKLVEEYDKLPWQHLMFFQRDDAPEPDKKSGDNSQSGKQPDQP